MSETIEVRPIGVVRSPIADSRAMPKEGVEAEIHLAEPYRSGLIGLGDNSHVVVLGWFDRADRTLVTIGPTDAPRGVFGLRSPVRPNPIGLAICPIREVTGEGVRVGHLDFLDGTPIVDLKRYSPSWDNVFGARSARDRRPADNDDGQIDEAIREAAGFHGELCPAVIAGSRLIVAVAAAWNLARKAPELGVQVSSDGCLADTCQALTAATFGSGRLRPSAGPASALRAPGRTLRFVRREWQSADPEAIRTASLEDLFAFLDPAPWQAGT